MFHNNITLWNLWNQDGNVNIYNWNWCITMPNSATLFFIILVTIRYRDVEVSLPLKAFRGNCKHENHTSSMRAAFTACNRFHHNCHRHCCRHVMILFFGRLLENVSSADYTFCWSPLFPERNTPRYLGQYTQYGHWVSWSGMTSLSL